MVRLFKEICCLRLFRMSVIGKSCHPIGTSLPSARVVRLLRCRIDQQNSFYTHDLGCQTYEIVWRWRMTPTISINVGQRHALRSLRATAIGLENKPAQN